MVFWHKRNRHFLLLRLAYRLQRSIFRRISNGSRSFRNIKKRKNMKFPSEWTQKEFLQNKKVLEAEGIKVLLIDTILSSIENADTVVYNPYELNKEPEGSVFVFYCDSGKSTLNRLEEYKKRFPLYNCISLKGGRGYWRINMSVFD